MPSEQRILPEGAQLSQLLTGFGFTEGPIWDPRNQNLVFSDIPGDRIHIWTAQEGLRTLREPSNLANGNTYDRQGRMLTCEHATSRVTRTEADGTIEVLASHYQGKELNSPNDIIVDRQGLVYFTDPEYGRELPYGVDRDSELNFRAVYRFLPGEELEVLADDFDQPNGLCLSLDERILFVNDTERGQIRAFHLSNDGAVDEGKVWANLPADPADPTDGKPDGMKVDSAGRLFCTGPFGIHVYDDQARKLGVIEVPERAANFTWGGPDMRTLYITATTSIYAVEVAVPGPELF